MTRRQRTITALTVDCGHWGIARFGDGHKPSERVNGDTSDCSRDLIQAVPTGAPHDCRHHGKQHEHEQRHEAGDRREAPQVLMER
jgi:hypothetical protein